MKPSHFLSSFCLLAALLCCLPSNVSSVAVMSIDLGSEWMKIAIVSPGVPMEIILNTDSQRKTPLVVAFRDGERFIGDAALTVGVRFPEKTFTHFLDLVGKSSLKSVAAQKYKERFPYHNLVETENGQLAFVLKDNGQEVQYTPEELLSMLLSKARTFAEIASASSSQSGQAQIITDCVLTVPPYFSQAERRALKDAANLAGLKVLQLLNANTAFALNYGVFRRKDFNSTPTNILLYDMGAGDTVSTIVSFQVVKTKERGFTESNPQLSVKGVGYDRYLGGFEFQLRLRDHLVKLFAEQSKKTVDEISKNKRAMAKLLKEAGRLKKVLSANNEHKAQVENVMNDIDLKAIVTREQFEALSADLLNERVTKPLDDVLQSSGYQLTEIDSFIVIGGATRIPKVQQLLQEYFSRELSKNINADEAGALGAAYQAAYLSKGFKVKTFHVKDANLFQINADFDRLNDSGEKKTVSRALFGRNNLYPQKKVITYSKHKEDFDIMVNYGEPVPQDSPKSIYKVSLKNIAPVYDKYTGNSSVEAKGIKVHFSMDESGILSVTNSEALFEVEYEEVTESDQYENLSEAVGDAISKFGSTISKLFSGNEEAGNETQSENATTTEEATAQLNETKTDSEKKEQEKPDVNQTESSNSTTTKQIKKELKKKTVKEEISSVIDILDIVPLPADVLSASKDKLKSLNEKEIAKLKRDQAKNTLESFILETRDKLEQNEFASATTDEEKTKIESELRTASDWLEYESDGADAAVFEEQIKKLASITNELFNRVREHRERPEALGALRNILNISDMFHSNAINMSEDDQVFSQVELTNLRVLVDETQTWMEESVKEQALLPANVNPTKLTLRAIAEKIAALDREVKYLLNKARVTPPKKKPKKEESKKDDNSTDPLDASDPQTEETTEDQPTNESEKSEKNEKASEKPVAEEEGEKISPEKVVDVPPKTEL